MSHTGLKINVGYLINTASNENKMHALFISYDIFRYLTFISYNIFRCTEIQLTDLTVIGILYFPFKYFINLVSGYFWISFIKVS